MGCMRVVIYGDDDDEQILFERGIDETDAREMLEAISEDPDEYFGDTEEDE